MVVLWRWPAPPEVRLALGAVAESLIVFLLLLANAASLPVFLGLAAVSCVAAWRIGTGKTERLQRPPWIGIGIFAAFGLWYLVNALAPETTPDGITYHLGLTREYVRLGGFPDRVTFYDLVPQGMEMLYTVAFALGRHAAAKLVEFGFFVAGVPLILRIGPRLGMSTVQSLLVAVFYFCAPVIGLTGSSSYNDASGVVFLLAAIYLAVERRYFHAGLCAGFCYAIKMPGLLIPACAVIWLLASRRVRGAVLLAAGAGVGVLPWLIRALALTGNPFAPLASRVFPNPYFHMATEAELAAGLRSMHGIPYWRAPWELAFGDGLAGTYGPLLLALPIGLWALRRTEGRRLWLGALVLAVAWITNSGARFLMQSLVLAAFALAMVLPARIAWAGIALQAVLCWPVVLDWIQPGPHFRLREFPVSAALGIEPESSYLERRIEEYPLARMIERATPPDARILSLVNVANAYLDRDVAVFWQSAEADILTDSLRLASVYQGYQNFDWHASWPAQDLRGLRLRMPSGYLGEWDISEMQILSGDTVLANSPQWSFAGNPNRWEGGLVFDGNLATRWRTWETVRAGVTFEVAFGYPQRVTSVSLVTHAPIFHVAPEVWGRDPKGEWRLLAQKLEATPRASQDLRLDAARALRRAGFRYLLVATGQGGNTPIGNRIVGHEADWGMERARDIGQFYLLRVK